MKGWDEELCRAQTETYQGRGVQKRDSYERKISISHHDEEILLDFRGNCPV
jgi:hypothetical protein